MLQRNPGSSRVFNKLGICIGPSPLVKTYRVVSDSYESVPMDIEEPSKMVSPAPASDTPAIESNSVDSESKSASPVGFEDELDDADVEELLLRKQLLVSALNQCDGNEEGTEDGASSSAEQFAEEVSSENMLMDGEDEEESALRLALLGSLRSDVEEADLRSSLIGSGSMSLESDLRVALLGGSTADNKEMPSPASLSMDGSETSKEVVSIMNRKEKVVIRSTKVTMSLQEIAATSKYAPKVDPLIIPLGEGESSSEEEVETEEQPKRSNEPVAKKSKVVPTSAVIFEKPPSITVAADPKHLPVIKRIIAVKQADVARAEQLVDHLSKKLKNAEHILDINKQQLKMYREKETAMMNSLRNNSPVPTTAVAKPPLILARNSPDIPLLVVAVHSRPRSALKQPTLPTIFYAQGSWLNFDEFLPALHQITLVSLRKDEKPSDNRVLNSQTAVSLRWLLLTNQNAPSLDLLRSLLFTNYFHAIACPYDLSGECKDRKCPFEHIKNLGVDWILVRLASLCPQALGLSEQDFKDKQTVKQRIQSVLTKFQHGKKNTNNESDLVHFVWSLVRSTLLAEMKSQKQVNLSQRVSAASSSEESLSILSDQDVNQVVSGLTATLFNSKNDQNSLKRKFGKPAVSNRIKTLCQVLKCRGDFSTQLALNACFSEFISAKEQLEVADLLLQTPSIVLQQEPPPTMISHVVLVATLFKLNLILTTNPTSSLGNFCDDEKNDLLLPEDSIYLRMVLIHAMCYCNVPKDFLSTLLIERRSLFATNFWSEMCQVEQNSSQIEQLLTSCVSSCQSLVKKQPPGGTNLTLEQSKLVFSVLNQALTYRLWKAMRDLFHDHGKVRKTCEKFFAKLCVDFPRFSVALTLVMSHQFAHFLSPSEAIDFLFSSPAITPNVRLFPSIIYIDTLLRLSVCDNRPVLLPKEHEIAMISRQFDPGDGCGVLGISEHFFLSLLRVFCTDRPTNGESFRFFTKSIFCPSLVEKLMVMLSFAIRTLLAGRSIGDVFASNMVSPYFGAGEVSTQKQRLQLVVHSFCSILMDKPEFELLERTLDATDLSNEFLLDRMIDQMKLDLTYLAGLACRLSCEFQLKPRKSCSMRMMPCQDALVRLISVLSSPNAANSNPQTRAVVIHSAFRLASCCLVHHPYDIRLWKLLFTCQRSLSSKFDPLRMYCRLLNQLGLNAPI